MAYLMVSGATTAARAPELLHGLVELGFTTVIAVPTPNASRVIAPRDLADIKGPGSWSHSLSRHPSAATARGRAVCPSAPQAAASRSQPLRPRPHGAASPWPPVHPKPVQRVRIVRAAPEDRIWHRHKNVQFERAGLANPRDGKSMAARGECLRFRPTPGIPWNTGGLFYPRGSLRCARAWRS